MVVDRFALIAGSSLLVNDDMVVVQDDSNLSVEDRAGLRSLCDTLRVWLVRLFVDANPKQVILGSDWPHTQCHKDRVGKSSTSEKASLKVDDKRWTESISRMMSAEEWQHM